MRYVAWTQCWRHAHTTRKGRERGREGNSRVGCVCNIRMCPVGGGVFLAYVYRVCVEVAFSQPCVYCVNVFLCRCPYVSCACECTNGMGGVGEVRRCGREA